ncbi:SOS response-associated peptidase family protein [Phenylobacterium sp. SCN 70-31]|uniref:SOS response-associated peptidase n=1 Tax=Phenylobacterium sp. SCN 70-31 TaxID=1660129 RepID=UPI00086E9FB7|nr:SOS response-associated peptidase family protein [Phenylobacterium sp. SCN 70-31]ODT86698.1 MAG: hypothetical protein ABS78_15560 [Phenylobacterium sp. SCN 70-31]
MCNLYTLAPGLDALAADFEKLGIKLRLTSPQAFDNQPLKPYVAPKGLGIFARPIDPAAPAEGLEPVVGTWGVIPFFHKGPAKAWKSATNNARSEDMLTKPTWRGIVKTNRCIIPADAFTEWTGPKGAKTKHAITRADGQRLFFAGLWADHTWEGERTESYTMVMQAAGGDDDMAPFHDRQPVVLDRDSARLWLDLSADPLAAIRPPLPGTLAFDPPEPAAA